MSAPPPPPPSRVFAPTPRDPRAQPVLDDASPVPVLPKTLSAHTLPSQQWPSLPPTPSNTATSTPNPNSNQISMPFIKRHIRRRLTNAKETCDKELHKVIHSITTYVEERLREPSEPDYEFHLHDLPNHGVLTNPMTDDDDDDESDDDHDADYRSRQVSASSSPNSFRRPLGLPTRSIASTSSYGDASPSRKSSDPLTRQHMPPPPAPNWQQLQGPPLSRRLSRSRPHPGSLPINPPSNSGSRSASRSRSPLPSAPHESQTVSSSPRAGTNSRRLSRMDYEEVIDPFMSTLHEMTAIATDVVDMSINQITAQPKACTEIVQKVQAIGRAWDEHPDWHGRAWYVQLLLAVAGLSRVVEWWEAEKQFWNFDEDDESEMEPMVFVMKPSSQPASANLSSARELPEVRSPLSRASSSGTKGTPLDTAGTVSGEVTSEGLPENSTLLSPEIPVQSTDLEDPAQTDAEHAQENAQETETLRIRAEEAQAVTIVLELALDGEELLWTNRSWSEIIGSNPEDVIGTAITRLLAPEHADVFVKSTRQLREDDSHTIEVVFQMRIETGTPEPVYQQFEGKGMLMLDRVSGEPSHTMWVLKPVGEAEADDVAELELPPAMNEVPQSRPVVTLRRASTDSRLGMLPRPFSHAPVLCRICECQIPDWFFEKHNETCHELHRLEAEIGEYNDTISELRTTIRGLTTSLDRASPVAVPEYRGVSLVNPSPSPLLGMPAQQALRPHGPHAPLSNRLQRGSLRKQQHQILQLLDDILQIAQEIAIPGLREDQHDIPIERQRLMSPPSEHKIEMVQKWTKPHTDDPGLNRLGNDVYAVIRHKVDSVNRLTNTIRYAEKVRREWEEQMDLERTEMEPLEPLPEGEEPESGEGEGEGEGEEGEETEGERDKVKVEDQEHEGDDASSTTSEYAFGRDAPSEPTLTAPSPDVPANAPVEPEMRVVEPTAGTNTPESIPIATPAPRPPSMIVPQTFHGILNTRSSTPSSISSPLATAAPIIAAATPEYMSLNPSNELSPQTVRTRRSVQNVSLLVTPPMSPSVAPQDEKTAKKTRRMSTIQPIIASPTSSSKDGPLSPRIPYSTTAAPRPAPSTIKDFEIIKPISKGAFGSVFLAKKKTTGDYFAIKVLKKADMIAKNQITNVKAERMILMKQSESPFVVKLYFTFQSKENLYLVMEYLNGGDCASLIKTLGALPEEWTRAYIAEVTLGLEYLHAKGVVHRDLKPDNLLIDQHGHLKLTDFGLSRIGLLGRQTRESTRHAHSISSDRPFRGDKPRNSPGSRPTSMDSPHLHSPIISPEQGAPISYFSSHGLGGSSGTPGLGTPGLGPLMFPDDISESSGSESVSGWLPWRRPPRPADSPMQSFATDMTLDLRSTVPMSGGGGGTPPANEQQKFVGTPDYLAPETILGIGNDDTNVDWWALGVITYEFLYGFPPFHASTPQEVFDNIISRRIDWHEEEEEIEYSGEARSIMERLMTTDITQRLGYSGADEVKLHPWFTGVEWDKVTTTEAQFVPQVTDPESTDYFDARGALPQIFQDEDPPAADTPEDQPVTPSGGAGPSIARPIPISKEGSVSQPPDEEWGAFSYKNLPVLKQANDDVIRKMRTDQMAPMTYTLSEPTPQQHHRRRSVSQKIKKPLNLESRVGQSGSTNPPSPSTSTSSIASSPSRGSIQPSTPASSMSGHVRRPSEFGAVERFKSNHLDNDGVRRNSMPSRLRTSSISSQDMNAALPHQATEEQWTGEPRAISPVQSRPASVVPRMPPPPPPPATQPAPQSDRGLVVLIAEDNPISSKVLETLLTRMGCRCVVVADGSEAISVAMGDIKFDCILMDYQMPSVDGEVAARLIKTTKNKNSNVPIVAVSAYSGYESALSQGIFAAALSKPLSKTDLLNTMRTLGFKTSQEGAKRKLSSTKPS